MKLKLLFPFLIALLCITYTANAQPWLKNLPAEKAKQDLTFFDYKKAFNDYWEPYNVKNGVYYVNGVKKKARGWKQFKRWEYYISGQINPTTGAFPKQTAQQVYKSFQASNPPTPTPQSANWINLGTNNSGGGYAGIGRVACIAFHPSNATTYWVGAGAGGLWKTTNDGATWTCSTDQNGVLAVSDIAIPSDFGSSNTIYIATGDRDAGDNNSIGVLKSTDGGTTWAATGLTFGISSFNKISKLLIDPTNNQTILAATTSGLLKTTNGGTTWSTQLSATYFIDLEYMPGNFSTLYGSTTDGKIYVSTNGGSSWTQAFTDASAYRIELAVSANQPSWVYAVAAASDNSLYNIYKSTNSGASYSAVFSGTTTNMLGYNDDGSDMGAGQGWYDLTLEASPTNANIVVLGGCNAWRTDDGGNSWAVKTFWSTGSQLAQTVHADKHCTKFHSNGSLFQGCDGGIYKSADNGDTWVDKSNGLVISQMYKLGISKTVPNETITGLQDNGSKLLSGGTWNDVKGGDGMECLIDYSDNNVQYATYVNGQITRTIDHWVNDYTDIEPTAAGSGAWVTPYIIDPVNPQTLYAGYADVWKTTDRGTNWTSISSINSTDKIRSMAIAPSNNQVLYVADNSIIWKTTDGGSNWTDVTGTLPVSNGSITYISIKGDDPNTVWITLSGYTNATVFESTNAGGSWTNISTGLPQIPAYTIVQNTQSTSEVQLYVGTEVGVFFKQGSNNWTSYNTNLPNVRIGELEIYYDNTPASSKLRAATYGRGLWETDVYFNVPSNMSYVSSTTTQTVISNIAPSQTDQQIIGIEVVNIGSLSPLTVTSFNFTTGGSTNPAIDISSAKLYYTGNTNAFATNTLFGTTNTPNGAFTVTGSQAVNNGTNYFWLTYDVTAGAGIGDSVDAICSSFVMSGVKTPTITTPSGYRIIDLAFCNATANTCDEFVANVTAGTINNTTTCSTGGYADYTAITTSIPQGDTVAITVTNGNNTYPQDECGIWVDWNNNADFTDDGTITVAGSPGVGPYTANIICPPGATLGLKRMRIRIHYNSNNSPELTTPCGANNYGEAEDYKLNVIAPLSAPVAGTANSNQNLCAGDSTSLTLTGSNGTLQWQQSANGTSGWTNVSSGTGATSANYTTGNLATTMFYRVLVSQTGFSPVYSNVITVIVNQLPSSTVSVNGNILVANQMGATYQWLNCNNGNSPISGATTQNYTPTNTGDYAVEVTLNGCQSTSTCYNVSFNGITEIIEETFNVYPSPAEDMVIIKINNNLIGKPFTITDESGKLVLTGRLTNEKSTVRVNELASGIYIVNIANHTKKIVKK